MSSEHHPHPLDGKYEAEAKWAPTAKEAAAMSIAISLKRIADQLSGCGQTDHDTISLSDVLKALPFFLNK
jgi:hypothetical protein